MEKSGAGLVVKREGPVGRFLGVRPARPLLVALLAVVLLIALSGTVFALGTLSVSQVTTDDDLDQSPRISGDRVVWYGPGSSDGTGDYEIFTWAVGETEPTQLTVNITGDSAVQISGDRVVWQAWSGSDGGADHEIYTWAVDDTEPTEITTDDDEDLAPQVSGDLVAWYGSGGTDGGTDTEIFTWTLAGGLVQITTNDYDDWGVRVADGRLAWVGTPVSYEVSEIFTWTESDGVTQQLTSGEVSQTDPVVSGGLVAWTATGGTDSGEDTELFMWASSEGTVTQITTDAYAAAEVQVVGDRVVWMGTGGSDDGDDWEVFTWTPGEGINQLTADSSDEFSPRTDGDTVVWCSAGGIDGGSDYEIFLWSVDDEDPTQVTLNVDGDVEPQVAGELVVWSGTGGSDAGTDLEIFIAAPAVPTVTEVSPDTGSVSGGNYVTITGTGFTDEAEVNFGDVGIWDFGVESDTEIWAYSPAHEAGTVQVQVTVDGRSSADTAADDFTYVALPTVTSVTPDTGPSDGSILITILGSGFNNAETVYFGGAPVTWFNVVNDGEILTSLPEWWWGGRVDVRVNDVYGGTSEDAGTADDFMYVAPEPAERFVVSELTDNSDDESVPEISGDRVVWSATGGSGDETEDEEIFTWQFGNLAPTQLTDNDVDDFYPTISGNRIAWQQGHGEAAEVFTWTPVGVQRLTDNNTADESPVTSGDRVAWQRLIADDTYEIVTWKAGVETQVTDNTAHDVAVAIDGDRLVWTSIDADYAEDYEVFTWKAGDTDVTQLTDNSYEEYLPDVSGDRVVWFGFNDDGPDSDIYSCIVGQQPERLEGNEDGDYMPRVSGDRVSWESFSPSCSRIYTWTPDYGPRVIAEYNQYMEFATDVSGDRVVWCGFPSQDVFLDLGSFQSIAVAGDKQSPLFGTRESDWTFKPTASVTGGSLSLARFGHGDDAAEIATWTPDGDNVRVTTNTYADLYPAVSGDKIVWLGDDGEDYEVYLASLPVPRVESVTPNSGPTTGGTAVTITGTDLGDVTAVTFGGVAAQFQLGSDTSLTAVSPAHVTGAVAVQVTGAGGTSTNTPSDDFTYVPATLNRYQQTDGRIYFTPGWYTSTYWPYSGGTEKFTYGRGASAYITFVGSKLDWIAKTSRYMGIAEVSVDGGASTQVNLYTAATKYKQKVWSTGDLSYGLHWVRITCPGVRSTGGGVAIALDAVDVAGTLIGTTRHQENAPALQVSGTWVPSWSWSYSGGRMMSSNTAGSSVTIKFQGAALKLVGTKTPYSGKAWVSVDGGAKVFVDLYNYTKVYKQTIFSTGYLAPGEHTVTITWSGQKNFRSSGYSVNLDAVDVLGVLTGVTSDI